MREIIIVAYEFSAQPYIVSYIMPQEVIVFATWIMLVLVLVVLASSP